MDKKNDDSGFAAVPMGAPTVASITQDSLNSTVSLTGLTAWVYDDKHAVFYVATSAGLIETYDPQTQVLQTLIDLGVGIHGLAISPDDQSLYVGQTATVADPAGGGLKDGVLDRINLSDLSVTPMAFTLGAASSANEQGPYSIVITPSGTGYFTTSFQGSGGTPLRTFQLSSSTFDPTVVPTFSSIGSGIRGPVLALSEDGRYLLVEDQNNDYGPIQLVDASTGAAIAETNLVNLGTNGGFNSGKQDISAAAGLVLDLTFNDILVLDLSLDVTRNLSALQSTGGSIIGGHFSEDGSHLYLWDEASQDLLVYSTSSWLQTNAIPLAAAVTGVVALGDPTGDMSLGDGGRLLFLQTRSGFEIVDLWSKAHSYDFQASGASDLLIENTSGAVVVGAVSAGKVGYTQVAALGPEWAFKGVGDFLADGHTDFLIENARGEVVVGEVSGGQASYSQIADLGPEWSFHGVGDFLGDGKASFLIENTSGQVVLGEVTGGLAVYTPVAALGPEWSFFGAGDFLGDGKADFLIENTSGVVAIGEIVGATATYSVVGGLGPEWRIVGSGNLVTDGKAQFLIENVAGAVVLAEVSNNHATYTQIAALGPEWSFKGVGDYLGEGHDQFLIENTSGAVDVGDWTGGQIHYAQVAALGSEWAFH